MRPESRNGMLVAVLITCAVGIPSVLDNWAVARDAFAAFAILATFGGLICRVLRQRRAIPYLRSLPVTLAMSAAIALVLAFFAQGLVLALRIGEESLWLPFMFFGGMLTLPLSLAIGYSSAVDLLGFFVSLGVNAILGSLIGNRLASMAAEPLSSLDSRHHFATWFRLFVPVLPLLFYPFYQPVNRDFTVKVFGCGCHYGFNANCVNTILGAVVLLASCALLALASRFLVGKHRVRCLVIGGAIICLANGYLVRGLMWL